MSYSVASELKASALDSGLHLDELILVVLVLYVMLAAFRSSVRATAAHLLEVMESGWAWIASSKPTRGSGSEYVAVASHSTRPASQSQKAGDSLAECKPADKQGDSAGTRSPLQFVEKVLEMAERITLNLAVQLVASAVSMTQPVRMVRVLSLVSVSVFFMFIQEGAALSRSANC